LGLIDSLESCVAGLRWKPSGTEWADYYQDDSYTAEALDHKKRVVGEYLDRVAPRTVWGLGANRGLFSRIAAEKGAATMAFDIDPACVEMNYLEVVRSGETNILPLAVDLTNPSPRIGWANEERMSLMDRGPADAAMALALIHHLAISNNVPLFRVAKFFGDICSWLIVEFVPKTDPKVRKLLATREDIFPRYTQRDFEEEFNKVFAIHASQRIVGSERTLYLMKRK
jgi:ribosomal protein L11 methylase PrmA